MVYGIAAAMPKPSFARAERSAALDHSPNRTVDGASHRRGDFVFVVNPKGKLASSSSFVLLLLLTYDGLSGIYLGRCEWADWKGVEEATAVSTSASW